MRTKELFLILFIFTMNSNNLLSQDNMNVKREKLGFFLANGSSYDWGKNAHIYSKNELNPVSEFGVFNKVNFRNPKYSFKYEYCTKFMNSYYEFANNIPGIANQVNQAINLKFGKSFIPSTDYNLDIFLGTGIYTVNQKRVPNPAFSDQSIVKDGYTAYWGMSLEFEFAASVPFLKGSLGMITRIFYQLPFTIASKENIPKFFHQGLTIGGFIAF